MKPTTSLEEQRHACEVAFWVRRGYTTRERLKDLGQRIERRRGRAAAIRLYRGIVEAIKGENGPDQSKTALK